MIITDTRRICAEIDLDAIEFNADAAINKAPSGVKFAAVIKADAYGHGAVPIAHLLRDKADYFAVATLDEGIEIRESGIKNPILVLGYFSPDYYEEAIRHEIMPVIFTEECAAEYSKAAKKLGVTAGFHFAADTGMSRIGFLPTESSADAAARIAKLPNIRAEGIFSHFATADEADKTEALKQRALFDGFIKMLAQRQVDIPIKHMDNSAGIMEFDKYYDMVREGITLYGLYPSGEVNKANFPIKPAMSLISHVTNVKTLPAGVGISYGRDYITSAETVVATVPVGYADGYPRCLSNRGKVLIHGEYCPILGRICMDQFMVDVTAVKDVKVGDKVTLVGKDGNNSISAEDVADNAYSFNYEFVCGISRRVPRVYIRHGKKISARTYLDIENNKESYIQDGEK